MATLLIHLILVSGLFIILQLTVINQRHITKLNNRIEELEEFADYLVLSEIKEEASPPTLLLKEE